VSAPDRVWTVLDLLRWTTDFFTARGLDSPRLDAEVLLAFALGSDRLRLYVEFDKPVPEAERARFRELVRRRAEERVPVAFLTGIREFWSLSLAVTPDVLVPRPETETLVAAVLERLPDAEAELRVLDVGTGSGAIALALASERPKAKVLATDVSAAALDVARANAESLGLADRVSLAEGDLYTPAGETRFDCIVSNPPYLAEAERAGLAPELSREPDGALFAGAAGDEVLRRLVEGAAERLVPGALLAFELAPAQRAALELALGDAGFVGVRAHRDLTGLDRVLSALRGEA
jgi:release factor glutamine methyltransferase